jgi:diadenosine tetraphosphatase ApaH/serine/threonine PP2A family protein phosphatase
MPWVADLDEADLVFLRSAVLFDRDRDRQLLFVHGGLYPRYFEVYGRLPEDAALISQLDKKHRERLSRLTMIRHVDIKGQMVALGQETTKTRFWAETYDGREGLTCFGHAPALGRPRVFAHAIGLDTGCAFGGSLTAAVFRGGRGSYEFVSISARRKYADLSDEAVGLDGIYAE